jgi:geranylgeranyl diphosphate synthase type II
MEPVNKEYYSFKRKAVACEIEKWLKPDKNASRVNQAMYYSMMAGGKRIRPILCLASAVAVGGEEKNALPAACALEMVHTYSLIHDDLPALDSDVLRRGQPTCHVQFDEATAILAGDGLLTLAFHVLAVSGLSHLNASPKWITVIAMLAEAAGCTGMIEGQMQDILSEGKPLSRSALERMHALKTGAMIEAAVAIGAIIGEGTQAQVEQLRTYGRCIGLAFQVADDVLNVKGDPQHMGKAVGTDQARGKNTYPSLMGLEASETYARELVTSALNALDSFDQKADPLRAMARYIVERNR